MSDESIASATPEPIPQWNPYSRRMIQVPTIRVDLTGLLAFCYNEDPGECEVGIHNASDHFLKVEVFQNQNPTPIHSFYDHASTVRNESFYFRGSDELPGVRFFHPTEDFDRDTGNRQDFRFILDLESSEFYGPRGGRRTLTKRSGVLKPKLTFDTGLFYAAAVTNCLYRRQDLKESSSSIIPLGQIASHLGVAILLDTADYVDVKLPGMSASIRLTPHDSYQINLGNICDRDDCDDPTSSDPFVQNDFHFFHDTFIRNNTDPLLFIAKTQPDCREDDAATAELEATLGYSTSVKSLKSLPLGSDRAPCASAGYGSGGGLP